MDVRYLDLARRGDEGLFALRPNETDRRVPLEDQGAREVRGPMRQLSSDTDKCAVRVGKGERHSGGPDRCPSWEIRALRADRRSSPGCALHHSLLRTPNVF